MRVSIVKFSLLMLMAWAVNVFAQGSPWPMFRHDQQHTGRTNYTGPADSILAWTFQANDGIASSPSVAQDGTIYFGAGGYFGGGKDSGLYALNPNGSLKWLYKTGRGLYSGGIFSSPLIGPDGSIYFGSLDEYLYALEDSVSYAKLRWKNRIGLHQIYSSPVMDSEGNLFVGCLDFYFSSIRASDGFKNWSYYTNWCVLSSPAIDDSGIIYTGSKDHNLYAFVDSQNTPIWQVPVGQFYDGHLIDASPAIGPDGTIYVGSDPYGAFGIQPIAVDTSFWAINPNGSLKWGFPTGDGVESSPAIGSDGTIYFGSYDSCIYAIKDNGSQGVLKWKFKTGGPVDGSPTIDGDGIIYCGSRDSALYALFPDGTVKWKYKTQGGLESSPTIDGDGHLYIGSFDGRLYAFGTGAPDVGVRAINMLPQIIAGESVNPMATIRNFRATTQSFEVACIIDTNGVIVFADTVHIGNLPGGDSLKQSFAIWHVAPKIGITYSIKVTTILPPDLNHYNDMKIIQTTAVENFYICGDANSDGAVNVSDAVWDINYVFAGGNPPSPYKSGDANCDSSVNISDAVWIINYVFIGGHKPCDTNSDGQPDC